MRTLTLSALHAWHHHLGMLVAAEAGLAVRHLPRGGQLSDARLEGMAEDQPLVAVIGPFEAEPVDEGVVWIPMVVIGRRPDGRSHVVFGMTASWQDGEPSPIIREMIAAPVGQPPTSYRLLGAALRFLRTLQDTEVRVRMGMA